jgi:ferrochelatase
MDGILLVAHGTVETTADLPAFLRRIRRGREPSAELVSELTHRYDAIGGSPLLSLTRAQATALEQATGLRTWVGMRLWRPEVSEVLSEALEAGFKRLAVIPLAPFSVNVYHSAAVQSLESLGAEAASLELCAVSPWGEHPKFIAAHAEAIRPHLERDSELILTAHSLPMVAIRAGDTYAEEVRATARAVAAALGVGARLAYQSEGADGGQWLGPSLRAALEECAARKARHVVVAPIGFLADHVETLYDLDIEARTWARELGLEWTRVPALNLNPTLIQALADLARTSLGARAPA